jgi:hypothetical protein
LDFPFDSNAAFLAGLQPVRLSYQPPTNNISLTTNQSPATSLQYFSLRINQHQPSATSQTNRLLVGLALCVLEATQTQ